MSNEQINYKVTADGAEATAAGFNKVGDALDRTVKLQQALSQAQGLSGDLTRISAYTEEAAKLNATGESTIAMFSKLSAAANENGRAFGASSRTIQEAGTMIGRVFAETTGMGAYRGVIDTITRSAALLGSTLVSGAGAAAGGGVIAAVAGLAYVFTEGAREADELAKKTLDNAHALGTYSDQIKKLRADASTRISGANNDRAFESKLQSGQGSVADYTVAIAALKDLVKTNDPKILENAIKTAYAAGDRDTLVKLEEIKVAILTAPQKLSTYQEGKRGAQESEALTKQNAVATREIGDVAFLGETPANPSGGASGSRSAGKSSEDIAAEEMSRISKQDAADAEKLIAGVMKLNEQFERDSITISNEIARNDNFNEQQKRKDIETTQRLEEDAAQQTYAAQDKIAKRQQQERSAMLQNLTQLGKIAESTVAKSIITVAEGQKINGKAIERMIGEAMINEGVKAVFTGAIAVSRYDYSGIATMALGAAEIAAGAALTAAGSSGSKAPTSASMPSQPSNPNQNAFGDPIANTNQTQPAGPTIIYIDMPTVLSPSADDGMRVRQALQDANHVYGPPV